MEIITEKNFEEKTKSGLVLIDFYATWCGPCRMMSPILEEVGENLDGKVSIYKVDVDDDEKLARKFGILSIPTLIIFKDGKQVDKKVGYIQADDLQAMIEKHI